MPTVDTLKAYETLISARLPEDQAKAILEVVKTSQDSGIENLVTRAEFKEEMAVLRSDFKEEMAALRAEFKEEMGALRVEIYRAKFDVIKWLTPIIIGQGALVIAILRYLK